MKRRIIIFSAIFLFILILFSAFCLPFLISNGTNELESDVEATEVKDYFQETEKEKITIKDEKTGIEISVTQDAGVDSIVVENINTETKMLWNETPSDNLFDNSDIIKYRITLLNKNKEEINRDIPMKVKFPIPENYDINKTKIFRTIGIENNFIKPYTSTNSLSIYINRPGIFTIVNDTNNANDTCYIDVSKISLEYKNILSLRVYSELLIDHYDEMKILLWKTEKDEFTIKNADIIRTHNGNGLFKIENMQFKDIDDTIYIRLYAKDGKKEYYSTLVEYNILQYCINTYNSSTDESLKGLILGTICYSQSSNDYKDVQSDIFEQFALATNQQKTLLEIVNEIKFNGKNLYSEEGTNYFYGRNVDVNNKIAYNIYLKPELEEQIGNIKLVVEINNETYNINFKKDKAYGFYKATFDKIQPYDINTPMFLKIVDKDGNAIGGTLTDSVGTFIKDGMEEYTLDKDKNMFATTIFFMDKCEKYFAKQK